MTLWSQGCRELVKLLHGCDKVVTRLSQGCDKVARTLQPCHNLVISVWECLGKSVCYQVIEKHQHAKHDGHCRQSMGLFCFSSKRKLEESIEKTQPEAKVQKLKDLCCTWWIQRIETLDRFQMLHSSIIDCMETFSFEGSSLWSSESIIGHYWCECIRSRECHLDSNCLLQLITIMEGTQNQAIQPLRKA